MTDDSDDLTTDICSEENLEQKDWSESNSFIFTSRERDHILGRDIPGVSKTNMEERVQQRIDDLELRFQELADDIALLLRYQSDQGGEEPHIPVDLTDVNFNIGEISEIEEDPHSNSGPISFGKFLGSIIRRTSWSGTGADRGQIVTHLMISLADNPLGETEIADKPTERATPVRSLLNSIEENITTHETFHDSTVTSLDELDVREGVEEFSDKFHISFDTPLLRMIDAASRPAWAAPVRGSTGQYLFENNPTGMSYREATETLLQDTLLLEAEVLREKVGNDKQNVIEGGHKKNNALDVLQFLGDNEGWITSKTIASEVGGRRGNEKQMIVKLINKYGPWGTKSEFRTDYKLFERKNTSPNKYSLSDYGEVLLYTIQERDGSTEWIQYGGLKPNTRYWYKFQESKVDVKELEEVPTAKIDSVAQVVLDLTREWTDPDIKNRYGEDRFFGQNDS